MDRQRVHCFGVDNGFAHIAQRVIDGDSREHARTGRLLLSGDHHGHLPPLALRSLPLPQARNLPARRPDQALLHLKDRGLRRPQQPRAAAKPETSLALSPRRCSALKAGSGGRALHRVEPVHGETAVLRRRACAGRRSPRPGEGSRGRSMPERKSASRETITSAPCSSILGVVVVAEGGLGRGVSRVAVDGIPLHPLGVGVGFLGLSSTALARVGEVTVSLRM